MLKKFASMLGTHVANRLIASVADTGRKLVDDVRATGDLRAACQKAHPLVQRVLLSSGVARHHDVISSVIQSPYFDGPVLEKFPDEKRKRTEET